MKMGLKKYACLLMALVLTCMLLGGMAEGKVKLTWWTIRSEQQIQELLESVLADVAAKYDLEIVPIPASEYEQKLKVAISGGSAPDIFDVDGVYTANYAYIGALYPLDEFWSKEDFDSDYVQSSKDKCSFDGHIYAASMYETACALFYNKDHFTAAGIPIPAEDTEPWTFDQLIEAAQKCTIVDATGTTVQYGLMPTMNAPDVNNEGTTFLQLFWLWNHGAEVFDPEMTTASGYFDSEKSIAAIKAWQDLYQTLKVSPLETVTQGFQTGKISMMIHNISNVASLNKNYPDLNYGVMPMPVGENNYTTSGGWNIGIYSGTKSPAAAWDVISALTDTEGHLAFCEITTSMPSRISVIEQMESLKTYPLSVGAKGMLDNPRARPVSPAYAELSPVICSVFNAAAYGEDVETLVKTAVRDLNRILEKYE